MGPLTDLAVDVLGGAPLPELPLAVAARGDDAEDAWRVLRGAAEDLPAIWALRAESALARADLPAAADAVRRWRALVPDARQQALLDLRLRPYMAQLATFSVFDHDLLAPTALLVALAALLPAVVRLDPPEAERGHGTGFVVAGKACHPSLAGQRLVLTNAHVCSDAAADQAHGALPPEGLEVVRFGADEAPKARYGIARILWRSPADDLDACLLELEGAIDAEPLPMEAGDVFEGRTRALPIGFPDGGPRAFALVPHPIEYLDGPFVHYRSATKGGMSGSPVFDGHARVIALHHRGGGDANQGILMSVLLAEIQAELARALG